jgi:nitrous oxidase accessory protein
MKARWVWALSWLCACAGAETLPARKPSAFVAGPVQRVIPEGAVIAESSAQLQQLLAASAGPAEIWLRARNYVGDFEIARRVSLRAERGAALVGTGHNTVLRISADDVVVDNLEIRHSGQRHTAEDAGIQAKGRGIQIRNTRVSDSLFGVSLGPCPRCVLDGVHVQGPPDEQELKGDGIKLWESDDAVVRHCRVEHVRDLVVWYSRRVLLEGNVVSHSRYGSHFMYAHDSIVRDSQIENNVVGIFVMYSARLRLERNVLAGARGAAGVGVGFKESDAVQAEGNWIVANTTGVYLDETPRSENALVSFRGNHFAINDVALRFHGVREPLHFEGNGFEHNVTLADVEGGGDALAARFSGNHFSDYAGYDLDGDGRGDVAYQTQRLSGELVTAQPSLAFFHGTAALSLLEVVAMAAPVFASRLLLEDRAPSFREIAP